MRPRKPQVGFARKPATCSSSDSRASAATNHSPLHHSEVDYALELSLKVASRPGSVEYVRNRGQNRVRKGYPDLNKFLDRHLKSVCDYSTAGERAGKVVKIPRTTTLRFRPGVAKGSTGARRASRRCSTWMNREGPIGKLPCAQMLA